MPELPEVETIASALRKRMTDCVVASVQLGRRDFVRQGVASIKRSMTGERISAIERQGKRMWLIMGNGAACLIHLGMSGRVTLESPDSPVLPHTHLTIRLADSLIEMRLRDPRRFGGVWYFPKGRAEADKVIEKLGPDALDIKSNAFVEICRGRRPIKALLLDQRALAGVGNIYADEALFDSHIHPLTLANALSVEERKCLAASIRRTLRKAVRLGGSTLRDYVKADGSMGEFQNVHRIYGRESQACVRCKATIERIIVAQRSTHICTICQPLPI